MGRVTIVFWSALAALAFTPMHAALSQTKDQSETKTELATFGGGCFWCVEAVFERVEGVTHVVSGYSGGRTKNPTYEHGPIFLTFQRIWGTGCAPTGQAGSCTLA